MILITKNQQLMQRKIKKLSFKGQSIYVGIDVHLKRWIVTVLYEDQYHKTFSMNPSAKELRNYLDNKFPGGKYYSAYEAGFTGYSTHRELEYAGITNIIANPADIPTTDKERKQKEDNRDSNKIAKTLRSGDLQSIYVPDVSMMEFRSLVRYRKTLVKEIGRNKNRIKSFLHYNGIKVPENLNSASKYWSGKFTDWLQTVELHTDQGKKVLEQILKITVYLRECLLEVNRDLRKLKNNSVYAKMIGWLCSIPGVGLITAVTLLSEIGSFKRFKNLDSLCSYVGLVPTTNSSGEKDKVGSITPRANKPIRSVLIEAAWIASRLDPSLAKKYNELCIRMPSNEAIIRIAKKLLSRIRSVMINEVHYEYCVL